MICIVIKTVNKYKVTETLNNKQTRDTTNDVMKSERKMAAF